MDDKDKTAADWDAEASAMSDVTGQGQARVRQRQRIAELEADNERLRRNMDDLQDGLDRVGDDRDNAKQEIQRLLARLFVMEVECEDKCEEIRLETKVERDALAKALRELKSRCETVDAQGELHEAIDGDVLDAAQEALDGVGRKGGE